MWAAMWPAFWDAGFQSRAFCWQFSTARRWAMSCAGFRLTPMGVFSNRLWTNFLPRGQTGILDWYTVLIGVAAFAALALHGAAWLVYKLEGPSVPGAHVRAPLSHSVVAGFASHDRRNASQAFTLLPCNCYTNFLHGPGAFIFPVLAARRDSSESSGLYARRRTAGHSRHPASTSWACSQAWHSAFTRTFCPPAPIRPLASPFQTQKRPIMV